MICTVAKKDLGAIAQRAAAIAERKGTMPALAMLKLVADGNRLSVEATDLYQSVKDGCPAEVEKPGGIAVNAAEFVTRIKAMADGPIDLSTKDRTLVIKSRGLARKFQQRGLDASDFPPMPMFDADAARRTIAAPVLASLITHTVFSISTDETRAHLNSLLVEWDGDTLRAVSTDGHRLSKAERTVAGQTKVDFLLPLKAVRAIQELATNVVDTNGAPAAIEIVREGPNAFFIAGGVVFNVKLVDAVFPPWQQVIPKASDKVVRAPRALLLDALRAVSVAAAEHTGGIKFSLSKGKILLQSESPDSGNGDDELAVEYGGSNMSIGFNAKYLIDVLNVLSCEEVAIELSNELAPIVVKPVTETGTSAVFVVMPMRI